MSVYPPKEIGEIYHVINRGVEKREIFKKPQDYARFVLGLYFFNDKNKYADIWISLQYQKDEIAALLGGSDPPSRAEQGSKDGRERLVDLLAFVLMPNHFHLIIREIRKGGVASFMKKMGGYSTYFNKQYDRTGHLFQGRYKAVHIKDEEQLRTAFVYVHTNPVELKELGWKDLRVKDMQRAMRYLKGYRWSSYNDYVGSPTFPSVTQRDFFLDLYKGEQECQKAIGDWILFKAENAVTPLGGSDPPSGAPSGF